MKHNNLLNISEEEMQKNMVLLIEDEDQELSGASTPACAWAAVSAVSAVSALFQVTTACTTRCYHP